MALPCSWNRSAGWLELCQAQPSGSSCCSRWHSKDFSANLWSQSVDNLGEEENPNHFKFVAKTVRVWNEVDWKPIQIYFPFAKKYVIDFVAVWASNWACQCMSRWRMKALNREPSISIFHPRQMMPTHNFVVSVKPILANFPSFTKKWLT